MKTFDERPKVPRRFFQLVFLVGQSGQVMFGIENTLNPTRLTQELDFKDTWHFAVGAQ